MISFLVSVVLAILLFGGTISCMSKLFKLSDQASNSFENLVKEIKEFSKKSQEKETQGVVLVMDENSIIFKFDKPEDIITEKARLTYPANQCGGKRCMVLCKGFKEEEGIWECELMKGIPLEEGEEVVMLYLARLNIEAADPLNFLSTIQVVNMPQRAEIVLEKKGGKVWVKPWISAEEKAKEEEGKYEYEHDPTLVPMD